jgi:CMD domain protein
MSAAAPDVIDLLAGIAAGSRLDEIRAARPLARENAQASYLALFRPAEPAEMALHERYAVAVFVAALHRDQPIVEHYASGLAELGAGAELAEGLTSEIALAAAEGPYGSFPSGPLSGEDRPGPVFRVREDRRQQLGPRLAAAFEQAHLLLFHPRDATPDALQHLLDAGWSTTGIVTLSQLVAFLSFQIRVVAGLRSLAAASAAVAAAEVGGR